MLKNTVTGSFLANLFPSFAKTFLENATQDEVNKAEQEAAVIHQQLNGLGESGTAPTGAASTTPPITAGATTDATVTPDPAGSAVVDLSGQLTAMTSRATDAEAKVSTMTGQLTTLQTERDQYKAWYDRQAGKGTALPGADATNRGAAAQDSGLSPASAQALDLFFQSRAKA